MVLISLTGNIIDFKTMLVKYIPFQQFVEKNKTHNH